MLKALWDRRRDDEGFTLIELMVVVLIIGILIAIALPTFLGARRRAQDRAAQSSLRDAIAAAKTLYTDNDAYEQSGGTALTQSDFEATEPSLTWTAAGDASVSTGPKVVAWNVDAAFPTANASQEWYAAALSDSGTCFYIRSLEATPTAAHNGVSEAGTFYGSGTPASCTAGGAHSVTAAKF